MPVTETQEKKTLLVDDEPEENSNGKPESQEDEKFEESKYWKRLMFSKQSLQSTSKF